MASMKERDPTGINKSFSHLVDGFQIPGIFSEDIFRSAVNYRPRDDDLFIVTYPKCGTNWAQNVVSLILRHGEPISSFFQMQAMAPFLEFTGAKGAEEMPRPGVIKCHLPYHLVPYSDKAKYIYVTRNPKDCCVSFYHHMKDIPGHGFEGTFDEFFEMFISGIIDYEDYFDHLLGWYEHRNDANVLFVTYEEMKADIEAAVLKISSFIDDEKYAEPLRSDPEKLKKVLHYSSFDYMKTTINKGMDEMFALRTGNVEDNKDIPDSVKDQITKFAEANESVRKSKKDSGPKASTFVRKGIVGDWRNHFSADQNRRMTEKFAEKTRGTDIGGWWKEVM